VLAQSGSPSRRSRLHWKGAIEKQIPLSLLPLRERMKPSLVVLLLFVACLRSLLQHFPRLSPARDAASDVDSGSCQDVLRVFHVTEIYTPGTTLELAAV
jgi:hypothetical protein